MSKICFSAANVATLVFVFALIVIGTRPAHAQTLTTLYSFSGAPDGGIPYSGLIRDGAGNLYGTTEIGGLSDVGTVFKIDSYGKETILYSFAGYPDDGVNPFGTLVRDRLGNLYGTTWLGGSSNAGTVFKLEANGSETVLHTFPPFTGDGANPLAGLSRDRYGNLYGTTFWGGQYGYGSVFTLDPSGVETLLHSFGAIPTHGANPYSDLIRDDAGNLYGTTQNSVSSGAGTIFELDTSGQEKLLYSFNGGADGADPIAGLVRDAAGNSYGTTLSGGDATCFCGTVFKLDRNGKETVLYRFTGGTDGASPQAGLTRDPAGNLYGTTAFGGDSVCGCGTVFKIDRRGKETILHRFTGGDDGGYPRSGILRDPAGNLYGTTSNNGINGFGTVYRLSLDKKHITSDDVH